MPSQWSFPSSKFNFHVTFVHTKEQLFCYYGDLAPPCEAEAQSVGQTEKVIGRSPVP